MSNPGTFKVGDRVVVIATGDRTVIDGVSALLCPPILCKDGGEYFPKDLRAVKRRQRIPGRKDMPG